tara:strand:+ start:133 stop:390 length:258 start_codon:yes stop_codon:yes gene_type:complete
MKNNAEIYKLWSQVVQEAWDNPDLVEKLVKDPYKELKTRGLNIKEDLNICIHKQKDDELHLVLPRKPDTTIPDNILIKIVAGGII